MNATPRFGRSWLLTGAVSAMILLAVLMLLALGYGLPVWAPLNATTHAIWGEAEATTAGLDWRHTALGVLINVAACFFWAAVAVAIWLPLPNHQRWAAALAGLGTAAIAAVVDYGLMPERLRPGWELAMPGIAVAPALLALGIGLALGLGLGRPEPGRARPAELPWQPRRRDPVPETPLEALRHPAPGVIDERQGRIDPANLVTDDLNTHGNSNKQPGGHDTPS